MPITGIWPTREEKKRENRTTTNLISEGPKLGTTPLPMRAFCAGARSPHDHDRETPRLETTSLPRPYDTIDASSPRGTPSRKTKSTTRPSTQPARTFLLTTESSRYRPVDQALLTLQPQCISSSTSRRRMTERR
ncbi:unnamed protein product [Musa acuminata subsp. burmannicoides]